MDTLFSLTTDPESVLKFFANNGLGLSWKQFELILGLLLRKKVTGVGMSY